MVNKSTSTIGEEFVPSRGYRRSGPAGMGSMSNFTVEQTKAVISDNKEINYNSSRRIIRAGECEESLNLFGIRDRIQEVDQGTFDKYIGSKVSVVKENNAKDKPTWYFIINDGSFDKIKQIYDGIRAIERMGNGIGD